MIKNIFGFGCSIYAETIGEMWLDLVSAVLSLGEESFDEKRKRIALMNVRVKTMFQKADDKIIYTYIGKEKIKKMIDFTFSKKIIKDTDIIKSLVLQTFLWVQAKFSTMEKYSRSIMFKVSETSGVGFNVLNLGVKTF